MPLLKLHGIGEPSHWVAKRAHGELDQNIALPCGIIMDKKAFTVLPDFEAEANKIALAAVDSTGLQLGLKEYVACIEVAQAHPPRMLLLRQHNAAAMVEIE